MQSWISDDGRILSRSGRGRVAAVVTPGDDDRVAMIKVEIEVAARPGQARAIRLFVAGLTEAGSPAHQEALRAHEESAAVDWTIRWTPHSWVPAQVPITSLTLDTDTTAFLEEIQVVEVLDPIDEEILALLEGEQK